jgi:hypothetical protein
MADATFTAVDLSRLPAPDIIEDLDFETILADAAAQMRDEMAKSGLTFETRDSDPATKLLQVFAYYAQMLRQRINDAARAVMPGLCRQGRPRPYRRPVRHHPPDHHPGQPRHRRARRDGGRHRFPPPHGPRARGLFGGRAGRAYISHTLSADANVLDASATGPQPTISRPSCWAFWPTMPLRPIWSRP